MSTKTPTLEGSDIEKVDLRSFSIVNEKIEQLLMLYPEVRTDEGRIDFDKLRLVLGETVDVGRERYGMSWPGKAECFKTIQTPSLGTLLPIRDSSINFEETENIIIEGDNLEVLKLLQKSYLGKVKMIYIDPPYNTGNDFIYPDNYSETLQTYLEYTGQVDSEGRKFGTNADTDGRFHSKWLNMMYPRLYIASNLLSEDGSIWISIDDTEAGNLRQLCNEVFGEENFVAQFIWEKRKTRENRRVFSFNHDYILCYAKSKSIFESVRKLLPLTPEARARYSNPDKDPRGDWQSVALTAQAGHGTASQFYSITTPSGRKVDLPSGNCWRVTEPRLKELISDNRIWFGSSGNNVPRQKVFLAEQDEGLTPHTLWSAEEVGTTDSAKRELNALFGGETVFDTPKPVPLLRRIIEIATSKGDVCLDFFAGSGTLAEAVASLSCESGEPRRFVMVQLPESIQEPSEFKSICDICCQRAKLVLEKLADQQVQKLGFEKSNVDLGYRFFRLSQSNFKAWDAGVTHSDEMVTKQLELHIDHIRDDRTAEEILYELLLKSGFSLTTQISEVDIAGKRAYSVAGGAVVICLEKELSLELIREIAQLQPERVVCLDEGFAGNDQLKTNAVQTFKTKGVVSFRTV